MRAHRREAPGGIFQGIFVGGMQNIGARSAPRKALGSLQHVPQDFQPGIAEVPRWSFGFRPGLVCSTWLSLSPAIKSLFLLACGGVASASMCLPLPLREPRTSSDARHLPPSPRQTSRQPSPSRPLAFLRTRRSVTVGEGEPLHRHPPAGH